MKHKTIPAPLIAAALGFEPGKPLPNGQQPHYGRRALTGQYIKSYTRRGHLPEGSVVEPLAEGGVRLVQPPQGKGRISKGAAKRFERTHGTEGLLDVSESINARR